MSYTPDFEISENNTSQITSVHSEILDDNDDDDESTQTGVEKSPSEDIESSPFSDAQRGPSSNNKQQPLQQSAQAQQTQSQPPPQFSSSSQQHQQQQSSTFTAEQIQKTSSQELDEIEDIIRKLERLEKAQSILEDALALDEDEGNEGEEQEEEEEEEEENEEDDNFHELPDISEKSEKSRSRDSYSHRHHHQHQHQTNKSSSSSSRHSQVSNQSSHSKFKKSYSSASSDTEVEVESRNGGGDDMSEAINAGIETIRKLIEKDLSHSKEFDHDNDEGKIEDKNEQEKELQREEQRDSGRKDNLSETSSKSVSKQNSSTSTSQKTKSKSHNTNNSRQSMAKAAVPKPFDGSGDHYRNGKINSTTLDDTRTSGLHQHEQQQLRNEIIRQETLIQAYQNENEKLYVQLKAKEDEFRGKEANHQEEVNELKTQIATLKLSRLVPNGPNVGSSSPRLGSAHKGEFDRLNEELTVKSLMLVELRKEIALLKMEQKPGRPSSAKGKGKIPPLSIDKEKEYQDSIRNLQKQVRTLQRILYNKDTTTAAATGAVTGAPSGPASAGNRNPRESLASKGRSMSGSSWRMNVPKRATSSPNIDTEAIRKLEDKMEKERVDFQQQISSKQHAIEEKDLQINALKIELAKQKSHVNGGGGDTRRSGSDDSTNHEALIEQLESRLSAQSEIIRNLKDQAKEHEQVEHERNELRQEVSNYESRVKELQRKLTRAETLAKPSFRTSSATKLEPVKPTMNQEKEKEYQKQIQNLQKQVRTLQKILYSKDPGAAASVAAGIGIDQRPKSGGKDLARKPSVSVSAPPRSSYAASSAAQILQSTLENERMEFENLLEQKQKHIEEKEKQIRELKAKLSATIEENAWISSESNADKATYEEFRTKLLTQNKIIDSLKSRLASYSNAEAEKCLLRKEINHYEFKIQELQRKLQRAESLARPENEVLATLTEKVEDLHTRYHYRERQLDVLIDKLSLKTGHPSLRSSDVSPRLLPSTTGNSYHSASISHNNNHNQNHNNNNHAYNGSLFNDDITNIYRDHDHNRDRGTMNGHNHNQNNVRRSLDLSELSPSALHHLIPHRDI